MILASEGFSEEDPFLVALRESMNGLSVRFLMFSIGIGATIASSLVSIYILIVSLSGRECLVHEQNPLVSMAEIILLAFGIATSVVATEIYQKYQKTIAPTKHGNA